MSMPSTLSLGFLCPCRLLSVLMWIDTVGLLSDLPFFSPSGPPVFFYQEDFICKSNHSIPSPKCTAEVLWISPHSITPEGYDLVLLVGLLLRRFHLGGTTTWLWLRINVKGLGNHCKTYAIWPHSNLELDILLHLYHLVFQH